MKFTKLALALLACASLTSVAHAEVSTGTAKGKVNFVGSVVEGACNLSSDQADQTVDFGQVGRGVLANGGVSTKDFSITLDGCDPAAKVEGIADAVKTVGLRFNSAMIDATTATQLKNMSGSGMATDVAVEVTSKDNGQAVKFDGTNDFDQAIAQGDMTYNFQGTMLSPGKAPTTGKLQTHTEFVVVYK